MNCFSPTGYLCLGCNASVFNKYKECSVPADEETRGWKAGVSVSYCLHCCQFPQEVNMTSASPVTSKEGEGRLDHHRNIRNAP